MLLRIPLGARIGFVMTLLISPVIFMLMMYVATGDPSWRPFGATAEDLFLHPTTGQVMRISAFVHWDEATMPKADILDLAQQLKSAFNGKGFNAHVAVIQDPAAPGSYVRFAFGANEFGPFAPENAVRGIQPAIDAMRLTVK